jgi:hypothetical protein
VSAERKRTEGSTQAESWSLEDGRLANAAKHETLQRRLLQRRARTLGLTLRHSAYGYSLVDAVQNRIDGRNDMTLRDIARHLERL